MLYRFFIIINLVLFCKGYAYSQSLTPVLKNYTRKDGLPSNETYFILRDSKNYIWIATDQGVVRFNGVEMKMFELEDNVIFKIKEDERGRIWFFSYSGKLFYYFNEATYAYKYNDKIKKEIKNMVITDANVMNDEIWINSSSGKNFFISKQGEIKFVEYRKNGIFPNPDLPFVINIVKQSNFLFPQNIMDEDCSHPFLQINITGSNNISYKIPFGQKSFWHYGAIRDKENLYFFNSNFIIKLLPDGRFKIKKMPSNILGMSLGAQNNIWVGLSKNGAYSLSKDLEIKEHILSQNSVSSVTTDFEGGTWFSTLEKGAFYMNCLEIKKITNNPNIENLVFRTYSLSDSTFLFATNEGIFKWTNNKLSTVLNIKMQTVSELLVDNDKILLGGVIENRYDLGPYVLGKVFRSNDKLYNYVNIVVSNGEIFKLFKDIFYVSQGITFTPFKLNQNTNIIKAKGALTPKGILFGDKTNHLWYGTMNGLLRFNVTNDSLIPFMEKELLFKKGVTKLVQMNNGLYAIGISFGGLAIMKDSTIIGNITESNGLSSNSIKYILPNNDELLVATAKGISKVIFNSYAPLKYTIINLLNGKDFADLNINQISYLGKNILVATNNGVYLVNDSLITAQRTVDATLPFYINAIHYNNSDTIAVSSLRVPYKTTRLKIDFGAVSFANGDEIQYRYRIANIDTTWNDLLIPQLLLENLSPGVYKVQLQAFIKNQQRFSEIKELIITVEKPWWQNSYFRLLVVLLSIGAVFLFYKSSIKKINTAAKNEIAIKSKLLELEQTALRAQMNPHFIFNCLSSIQQLIVSGETEKANEYLVKFSRLMRLTLELSSSPYNSIADEITFLTEYISLEQLRFPNKFDYFFNLDSHIKTKKMAIPNMLLQPIVENAINHGIKNLKDRNGLLYINMQIENDVMICSITDNGVGRNFTETVLADYKSHKSFGMEIITKRLTTFNADNENKYHLEIVDLKSNENIIEGTKIVLYLPIKKLP